MRKLVVGSGIFLVISGLILSFGAEWEVFTGFSVISTLHTWAGVFFIVIFPMYAWDHIRTNRQRLKTVSGVSISGVVQLIAGVGLIFSGILLLLYGTQPLAFSTEIHFFLTFVLTGSVLLHFLVKK